MLAALANRLVAHVCDFLTTTDNECIALASSPASSLPRIPFMPATSKEFVSLHRRGLAEVTAALTLQDLDEQLAKALQHKMNMCKDEYNMPIWGIVNVENIVSPSLLQRFIAVITDLNTDADAANHLAPTIAFHGTWDRGNIDDIAAGGFVAAGDLTQDGALIGTQTGAVWGQGIYVSPQFNTAAGYAYFDSRGHSCLFVSVCLPGRCHRYTVAEVDLVRKEMRETFHNRSHDWWHKDDCHSHCTPDAREMIIYESGHLLPVFLVTFAPRGCEALPSPVPTTMAQSQAALSGESYDKVKKQRRAKRLQALEAAAGAPSGDSRPSFVFQQLPTAPGDCEYWLGSLTPVSMERLVGVPPAETRTHVVFLLDKSNSMGSNFRKLLLPACGQLHQRLQPTSASVVLFGQTVDIFASDKVTGAAFFDTPAITSTVLEGATDLIGGLTAAVNLALSGAHAQLLSLWMLACRCLLAFHIARTPSDAIYY